MTALNQTRYGLSSSIFTRDANTAFRAMRDFETGHRLRQRRHDRRRDAPARSAAGRRPATATARPATPRSTRYTEWKSIYVDFSGRLQRAQIDNQA